MPKDIMENYNKIQFKPPDFNDYLLDIGFKLVNIIEDYFVLVNNNNSKRNIKIYKKNILL
jgi:hypothetical protein